MAGNVPMPDLKSARMRDGNAIKCSVANSANGTFLSYDVGPDDVAGGVCDLELSTGQLRAQPIAVVSYH